MTISLGVGKLPVDLLRSLLAAAPISDDSLLLGPRIGADCAVLDFDDRLLVFKSDPITFATADIGWYLVQVNSNDIATTGARPRWLLLTMLLPENKTTPQMVKDISSQVFAACRELGISVIGGHTEITYDLNRPLLVGTLIGEVQRENLVVPTGMKPGNTLLLTKGIPIEGTAILAREQSKHLKGFLSQEEINQAQNNLFDPGISVLRDAQIAVKAGRVTAMHDPTEGGLAAALWEMAEASSCSLHVELSAVPIPELSAKICAAFGLDPFATIASGALLMAVEAEDAAAIRDALLAHEIDCSVIGRSAAGPPQVWSSDQNGGRLLPRPVQDEIGKAVANKD